MTCPAYPLPPPPTPLFPPPSSSSHLDDMPCLPATSSSLLTSRVPNLSSSSSPLHSLQARYTNFHLLLTSLSSFPNHRVRPCPPSLPLKGALKAHKHISLYESNTLQEQDVTILFLSVIPWGEIFAYCHPPGQPLPATGCGHVFQVLSAMTLMGGKDHILSPSYLWA